MRLHLGCGDDIRPEYINIDKFDIRTPGVISGDIISLDEFEDNSVDEILIIETIEHLNYQEFDAAVKNWYRVLKPKAFLQTECPDLEEVSKEIVAKGLTQQLTWEIYGQYWRPWDAKWNGSEILAGQFHKNGFTFNKLKDIALDAGFNSVEKMGNEYKKYKNPFSLCVRWYK